MRISYERTGGFAGMRIALEIDLDDLPEEQAGELEELLDQANFFDLPGEIRPSAYTPDQFQHTLTVDAERGSHTVRCSDAAVTEKLRPLVERLNRLARARRLPG